LRRTWKRSASRNAGEEKDWRKFSADPRRKNPVILAGDFNTSASDTSPTSVSKVITERLKDPDKWATRD